MLYRTAGSIFWESTRRRRPGRSDSRMQSLHAFGPLLFSETALSAKKAVGTAIAMPHDKASVLTRFPSPRPPCGTTPDFTRRVTAPGDPPRPPHGTLAFFMRVLSFCGLVLAWIWIGQKRYLADRLWAWDNMGRLVRRRSSVRTSALTSCLFLSPSHLFGSERRPLSHGTPKAKSGSIVPLHEEKKWALVCMWGTSPIR